MKEHKIEKLLEDRRIKGIWKIKVKWKGHA